MSRRLFLGTSLLCVLLAGGLAAAADLPRQNNAGQDARPVRHFSFTGKRPTFKEEHVKPEVVVSGADSEGSFSLSDEIWSPSFRVPAHYHKTHAETFYIVSGQVEWTVGGKTQLLKAGDLVHIPAYTVHGVKVVGNEDLRTVMVSQPGGFEEHMWFQESLTPEQLKDPRIRKQLAPLQDFYMPDAGTPLATQPVEYFSFAGKRPSYEDDGTSDVALSSKDSGGRLNVQDEVWKAGFAVGPHFHRNHSETFYVLDGRVEWTVAGETQVLSRGDAVHIPPNTVHSARALDNRPLHTLMFYNPSGYDEHLERQALYTAEELRDPAIRKLLRRQGDFNPVGE
ncbi:MAG: cupin domain-containing protein [Steroidobacteraceae bacterium]